MGKAIQSYKYVVTLPEYLGLQNKNGSDTIEWNYDGNI